jgi:hypothetical protein
MDNIIPLRIQIVSIIASFAFLFYVARLIIRGKLREEFAFFWIAGTALLLLFSFWRDGLEVMARLFGVYMPPNLVFMGAIFAILVYLLHLSTVVSALHAKNKKLSQDMALLKEKMERKDV